MKSPKAAQKASPWWRSRRNRNKVWLALLGVLVAIAVGLVFWLRSQGPDSPGEVEIGQQVKPFQLPNVVSGRTFSLADYLGKKEIVIVSYMGWF